MTACRESRHGFVRVEAAVHAGERDVMHTTSRPAPIGGTTQVHANMFWNRENCMCMGVKKSFTDRG